MMKSFIVLVVSLFVFNSCSTTPTKIRSTERFGAVAIMQGATTETQSQFVVAVPKQEDVVVELMAEKKDYVLLKASAESIQFDNSAWKLIQFTFSDLKPGKVYRLRVRDRRHRWNDTRYFQTYKGEPKKLAIVSCMRDSYEDLESIWSVVQDSQPDTLFMIGDNSYTDIKIAGLMSPMTAYRLWSRHMETRNRLPVFRWEKLVPVFATWDDHDYGINNGGRDFNLKKETTKIFTSFFPMSLDDSSLSQGPGVARSVQLGQHQFLFLDNRSFRSAKNEKKNPAHFGQKQNKWMFSQIKKGKLNWLIGGDQFFGSYHPYESFQGDHPKLFSAFMKGLKKKKASVLLVSGDRHLSELMKLPKKWVGYPLYEITSSPIHSSVYPGKSYEFKNPYQVKGVDGAWNFVMLDIKEHKKNYRLKVQALGKKGKVLFKKKIKLKKR